MHDSTPGLLATLAAIGAAIGLGQLFIGEEPITWRRAIGRALVTAGLAVGAAASLTWIPGMTTTALIGLGAAVATLGTAGLERLVQRWLPKQ